jgi:hypothetical protein
MSEVVIMQEPDEPTPKTLSPEEAANLLKGSPAAVSLHTARPDGATSTEVEYVGYERRPLGGEVEMDEPTTTYGTPRLEAVLDVLKKAKEMHMPLGGDVVITAEEIQQGIEGITARRVSEVIEDTVVGVKTDLVYDESAPGLCRPKTVLDFELTPAMKRIEELGASPFDA